MEKQIKQIIINSLSNTYKVKDEGKLKNSNHLRSSKFVSEIANEVYNAHNNEKLRKYVIEVDDVGNRTSGEWLLDIVITNTEEITDGKGFSTSINSGIEWAIESESNISLKSFSEDFSKLMCIKSNNYLYLNGLNQKTSDGRQQYIETRLKTIENFLKDKNEEYKSFYIGFWPSPEKQDDISIYDKYPLEELSSWIQVYKIGCETGKIEIKEVLNKDYKII